LGATIFDHDDKRVTINHAQVLGVAETATIEEIKRAYKRLAIKYHPDKQTSVGREMAERMGRRFHQIQEAHSVLSDATEKRLYDMKQRRGSR
jgi:DnaJ-class molecular chaperone